MASTYSTTTGPDLSESSYCTSNKQLQHLHKEFSLNFARLRLLRTSEGSGSLQFKSRMLRRSLEYSMIARIAAILRLLRTSEGSGSRSSKAGCSRSLQYSMIARITALLAFEPTNKFCPSCTMTTQPQQSIILFSAY